MTPSLSDGARARMGGCYALGAFIIWGIAPIYYKHIEYVYAAEILAHRIVWTTALMLLLFTFGRRWGAFRVLLRSPKSVALLLLTAALIGSNWFVFTWAVTHERVLETSMGYFINPLFNVLLAVVFLRERLNAAQIVALLLALGGVLIQIVHHGSLPWVAIALPVLFGFYGLLRKQMPVGVLNGMLLELMALAPLAAAYLLYRQVLGVASFAQGDQALNGWLLFAGPVTLTPLLLYVASVRLITFSTLGFMQYLSPSITFLIAVFIFKEPFGWVQLVTYGFIWAGLVIFTVDALRANRLPVEPR